MNKMTGFKPTYSKYPYCLLTLLWQLIQKIYRYNHIYIDLRNK